VILDIGMPNMDGYEVARQLRQRKRPSRQRLYIIGLSGYGQDQDRLRSSEAGFDVHLVKPVDFDVLQRLLADLTTQ
jgi:CheY-like chemotaxis protein